MAVLVSRIIYTEDVGRAFEQLEEVRIIIGAICIWGLRVGSPYSSSSPHHRRAGQRQRVEGLPGQVPDAAQQPLRPDQRRGAYYTRGHYVWVFRVGSL